MVSALRWIILGVLALAASSGQAFAQRLDKNDCNNGLYHIEDGLNDLIHMGVVFNSQQRTYCESANGTRSCVNGRELFDTFQKNKNELGIVTWKVTRMAMMPELIGRSDYACQKTATGYRLGVVIERGFQARNGQTFGDLVYLDLAFRQLGNGNISVLSYNRLDESNLPSSILAAGDPFRRRQFVFDRTYGNSRKLYHRSTIAGGAYDTPQSRAVAGASRSASGRQSGSSGSSVFTITRSGTSGLLRSSSAASQAARSAALNSARSACQSQGGRVISSNSVPKTTRKATDTTYRGTATATVRCRR
ncbi:MAG: hypothetical protein AAFX04_12045 [Pseudomonadota bacterium]